MGLSWKFPGRALTFSEIFHIKLLVDGFGQQRQDYSIALPLFGVTKEESNTYCEHQFHRQNHEVVIDLISLSEPIMDVYHVVLSLKTRNPYSWDNEFIEKR